MRMVLHHDDPRALDAALRERGVPDEVETGAAGEGPFVVVVIAQGNRVADAAARWLRRHPLPEGFIVGCTRSTRADCQPEAWWPASLCDMVLANDEDTLLDEIARRVARLAEMEAILDAEWLRERAVGQSAIWRTTLRTVAEIGRFGDGACLLLGESGCGKELLARLVHDLDPVRRRGPFVVVDCTTLSPELSGSELFGHAKGAFTHALSARDGAVAMADGGTLFLDEIGELEPRLQARLLRVIQERTYKRIGEDVWRKSDFRLTCATNRDLEGEVLAGRFRNDLYFRIARWTVRAPSLAERRDDIPLLVTHFLAEHGDAAPQVMPEVMQRLVAADYQGNVRELRNVVMRLADRQRGFRVLSTGCLRDAFASGPATASVNGWEQAFALAVEGALDAGLGLKNIGQIAESLAVELAERRAGSTSRAAELLQVTPRALQLRRQLRPSDVTQ
ncbi:putative two-component signal transduction system ATPase, Sigma-54 interaction and FIS domains [Burkholderia sp. YI23]|nr:putative two-component signal transduction system ATPase, Sigma-54 interaction and FIS domains [Burkholderia sp. YI23]